MIFEPGTLLAKKLRVRREIGRGSMGVVVEAFDEALTRAVAVKVMTGDMTPEMRARFLREARAVAELRSEYVVDVYDVGELAGDHVGTPFIVTELLEGVTLEQYIEKNRVASISDAMQWVLQASLALREVHAHKLVHRDVKLANMFLANRRGGGGAGAAIVKLIDFGIVKDTRQEAEQLTVTGEGFGTPAYMSPEQISGSAIDGRSDLWSLGVCLFELLTGELPFHAPTVPQILIEVLSTPAPHVSALRSDVPEEIDAIVMRCLEKDPAKRFASADDLVVALTKNQTTATTATTSNETISLTRPKASKKRHVAGDNEPRIAKSQKEEKRAPLVLVGVGAALLAILFGGAGLGLIFTRVSGTKPVTAVVVASASASASAASTSADVAVETPVAAESASAERSLSVGGDEGAPTTPSTWQVPTGFEIHRSYGNGELPNPSANVRAGILQCAVANHCEVGSIVHLDLYSVGLQKASEFEFHEVRRICAAANGCILRWADRWRPHGVTTENLLVDRGVELVFTDKPVR